HARLVAQEKEDAEREERQNQQEIGSHGNTVRGLWRNAGIRYRHAVFLEGPPGRIAALGTGLSAGVLAPRLSGVAEYRLQAGKLGLDPARIDRSPVADAVAAAVVAFSLALLEQAVDVQLAQRIEGVLGGAPGHAGGGHDGRHAAGGAAVDQPGDVQAAVEAGLGLARLHGRLPCRTGRRGAPRSLRVRLWPGRPVHHRYSPGRPDR